MLQKYLFRQKFMAAEPTDTSGVWIRVDMPDEKEKELLVQEYGVPADFISDMADADERPRIEYDDGVTLVVLRIPRKNDASDIPLRIYLSTGCPLPPAPKVMNSSHWLSA